MATVKMPSVAAPVGFADGFETRIKIRDEDDSRFSNDVESFSLQDTFTYIISFMIHFETLLLRE